MKCYEDRVISFIGQIKPGDEIVISDICKTENIDIFLNIAIGEIKRDWTLGINTDFTVIKRLCESDKKLIESKK